MPLITFVGLHVGLLGALHGAPRARTDAHGTRRSILAGGALLLPAPALAYGGLPERKGRITRTCAGSSAPECVPSSGSKTLSDWLEEQTERVECESAAQCTSIRKNPRAAAAVKKRAAENGPMQFHDGTEERLVRRVLARAKLGDPTSVLAVVDDFCETEHWMMNVGPAKGAIVDTAIRQAKAQVVVEFGTYVGYSTVRWASLLPEGGRLYSVDMEPASQESAGLLLRRAGLEDRVTLVRGTAAEAIPRLRRLLDGKPIDVLFIDHSKADYLPDLQAVETAGLLRKGSVVCADNVVFFQIDEYVDHVRKSGKYSTSQTYRSTLEYSEREATRDRSLADGVEVSVYAG